MKKMMILAAVIAATVLTAASYPASGKVDNGGAQSTAVTSCTNGLTADLLLACPGGCTNKLSTDLATCPKDCTNTVNHVFSTCLKDCTNSVSAVLAGCGKGCTNEFSINLVVGILNCTNNVSSVKI